MERISENIRKLPESPIRMILKRKAKFDFGGGLPGLIPKTELELSERNTDPSGNYGPTVGTKEFRKSQVDWVGRHGIDASPDDMFIFGGGSQVALKAISDVFVRPGDVVITTRPCYLGMLGPLMISGARIITIPANDQGVSASDLSEASDIAERRFGKVKFFYFNSIGNNPLGVSIDPDSKKEIFDVVEEKDILLIEDDPYGDLQYDEPEVTPIKTLDEKNERIIYLGSSSKTAAPRRIGWGVIPKRYQDPIEKILGYTVICPSVREQDTLTYFYKNFGKEWVRFISDEYRKKRDQMVKSLKWYFPDAIFSNPSAGFFVSLRGLKHNTEERIDDAIKAGVKYVPLSGFYPKDGYSFNPLENELKAPEIDYNGIRLSFSWIHENEIDPGIKLLKEVLA